MSISWSGFNANSLAPDMALNAMNCMIKQDHTWRKIGK
uniref:Uncharacterized protein n=1 Tax=Rhizophora mucronata TaxID=61149 RepID=A0A2P2N8U3_RHIMU